MPEPRVEGQAVRLDDGRVLIMGGTSRNNADVLDSAVLFDPAGS